ncbi:MAG: ABC transporter substrate-binding protein [Armatimonadota bacterium]|nr:ABC transporter substrate-binding protein [Armatimonadota bacterium]
MRMRAAGLALAVLLATGAVAAPAEPQRGGTAVVAIGGDPETLNLGITTGYAVGAVAASIFSGLVWIDTRDRIQPSLATSWTISPDGLTYTFELRTNVKWHDGRPFGAQDVKFTMDDVTGKYHGRFRPAYLNVESITARGPSTVVIRLKRPYAPFLRLLTVFDSPILPRHVYQGEDVTRHPRNNDPVGTGPFKFREWIRGDRLVLERNSDFWNPVYLDRLIFRVLPNPALRVTALEVGEVDAVADFYLPKTDVDRLRRNPAIRVRLGQPIPSMGFMFINTRRPPLDNVKVRRALALAINRVQIVTQAMGNLARPARGPFGDGFKWAYSPEADYNRLYPFSVERANALLDEAGIMRGAGGERPMRLRMVYDAARAPLVAAAAIIRDNLRAVGITVDLQPMDRTVMIDRVYTRPEYDLTVQTFTSGGDPAIGYHRIFASAPPGTPFVNATGYGNREVDQLLARAAETADQAARSRLYAQAGRILADDLPTLVLFDEIGVDAARASLRGIWTAAEVRDRWDAVWVQRP